MNENDPSPQPDPSAYRHFRPAWRSFAVYFFGAFVFLAGPMINPDFPLRPAPSNLVASLFLAFVLLKRLTTLYRLGGGVVSAETSFPFSRLAEAPIGTIRRIDLRRGLTQRLFKVAHVWVYVEGDDLPTVKLFGVPAPETFKRILIGLGAKDAQVYGTWRK